MTAADPAQAQAPQQPVTDQPMVSRSGIDLAALDKTANPCDDFYQFACGGWLAKQPHARRTNRATAASTSCRNATTPSCATSSKRPRSRPAPPSMRQDRRLLRELHGRERRSRRRAWRRSRRARPRGRASTTKARHPGGRRPPAHASASAPFFGFGAAPDFKDATQYIADLRPGRPRPARPRLLPEGRRELGEAARAVRAARDEDAASSPATRRNARPRARRR